MSNIPKARELLKSALADKDGIDRALIQKALKLMTRQPYARKVSPKSRKLTPELKKKIKVFARTHLDLSLQEIADIFDVNSGRISENIDR